MATYLGVDIGASSVRGVLVRSSYRRAAIESMVELDRSAAPTLNDLLRLLAGTFATEVDSVAVGLDGDETFVRTVEVPATAQRQLEEVLPFELEAQLPVEFSEAVYDHLVMRRTSEDAAIDVLAVAARTADVRTRIDLIKDGVGIEPERVVPGGFPLASLAATTPELTAPGPIAVLAIEERTSELLILDEGEPVFARTVSRGVAGLPDAAPAMARDLRQTISAWRAAGGAPLTALYLAGAGAGVLGAETFLQGELGLPVAVLPAPRIEVGAFSPQPSPRFAKATGLALSLLPRARPMNLRKGVLSYERGFGFLREKIPLLSGLGAVILLSFVFATWAEMRSLGLERATLESALSSLSRDVLGEETSDPQRAMELLDRGAGGADEDPLPHADGFDMMTQLAQAVPDTLVHDVDELDVQRGHAIIHGIVPTIPDAQAIATALKSYRCFQDVKIVRTNQVVGEDRQKYVLELDIKCPNEGKEKGRRSAERFFGARGERREQTVSLETSARDWFEKLQPRERRLALILAAAVLGFLLLLVPLGVSAALGSRRDLNHALSEAVTAIKNGREAVRQRQIKRDAIVNRYASHAPPLAGLIEKAARDNKLDVPESQDRPDVPHGKRYVERSTVVRLRKASMLQLAKMLEAIEAQRLPVSISRLNIRRRGGERDSYDIELGLSAYDRSDAPAGASGSGGTTPAPNASGGSK